MRALVQIEHDRVELGRAAGVPPDHRGRVRDLHADPRILHRAIGQPDQRTAAPLNDHRIELGDQHLTVRGQRVQHGPQGVAHAQAADQHLRADAPGK